MKQLLIISGKGGTGKTSLTACFAALAHKPVIVDCDVDAANLHLLLSPETQKKEVFYSGYLAQINQSKCDNCAHCRDLCRFDAIQITNHNNITTTTIDPLACEGCGVCADNCPQNAISMNERNCGDLFISDTRAGPMVHAKLGPGGENSGKLVSAVREKTKNIATEQNSDLIIIDGPPGIGCAVIASATGCDYAIIVTEPTLSGLHDLKRVAKLLSHFQIHAGVIINKADLNTSQTQAIRDFASENNLRNLCQLPYDNAFTQAQRNARILLEYIPDSTLANQIKQVWNDIQNLLTIPEKTP